jgi:hypothetical protein
MEEISWKPIGNHAYTVSIGGTEKAKTLFPGDPKMCLTAIVSISVTSDRFPMWVVAKVGANGVNGVFVPILTKQSKKADQS